MTLKINLDNKLWFKKILILVIILFTITSCKQEPIANYAILSGIINNAENNQIQISSMFTSISVDTVPKYNKILKLDDTGSFSDTIYLNNEKDFFLGLYRNSALLHLTPGANLQIIGDFKDASKLKFSGTNANINTYFHKKSQILDKFEARGNDTYKVYEKEFIKQQEAKYNEYLNLLNSSSGLSDEFINNEKKDITYRNIQSYITYDSRYKMVMGEDSPNLTSLIYNKISNFDYQNIDEYKRSTHYAFLLRSYYQYAYEKTTDFWATDPIEFLKFITKTVSNKNIIQELFMLYAPYGITKTKELVAYYKMFNENVSNKRYRDVITTQYNDLVKLIPGQPSPEFVNYKNADGGTNSLTDFRGKYVYIDVWATWCGPCKEEIPFLKKVEDAYHGNKNIEFLSISVDVKNNLKKWQNFVKDNKLGGVQLIADKDFKSEFIQKYQIQGIPKFILLDKEGNIVASDAPRPSDFELITLFNELEI
ncbi:TlpA family protein disulfide reductase [Lutibacter citreus]|uniref:TlpA family protein disulfide reductase n=1 Tax=Lutibacter citreus TaxID=2138210 RepID=UPI00130083A1|nr:TlpA disulfide reductase family protein [Lutibacter citreus]